MNEKYNGWSNYATWRINLEIFDGAELYGQRPEYLQEFAESLVEKTTGPGLGRDYALAFLEEVNWNEIAKGYDHD